MNWFDVTPPKWKDQNAKAEFLNRPIPDSSKNVCGMPNCGQAKFLVRNKKTDRFSDTFYCPSCDGDLG